MSNGLFDNVDDEGEPFSCVQLYNPLLYGVSFVSLLCFIDDQLFKDIDAKKPSSRETTPEFFSEVKLSDDMNLFSPSKPKDTVCCL